MHASCHLPIPSVHACWSCIARGSVPVVCRLLQLFHHPELILTVNFCTCQVCFHEEEPYNRQKFLTSLLPVQAPWGRLNSTPQLL